MVTHPSAMRAARVSVQMYSRPRPFLFWLAFAAGGEAEFREHGGHSTGGRPGIHIAAGVARGRGSGLPMAVPVALVAGVGYG